MGLLGHPTPAPTPTSYLRRTADRRGAHGAALLITVVLTMVLTLVALVLVTQALTATRSSGDVRDRDLALSDIATAQSTFAAQLSQNPWFFLTNTFSDEQDRVCTNGAVSSPVGPGQTWPQSCGSSWTYTPASSPGPVVAEIDPPSPSSPSLVLQLVATEGTAQLGASFTYRLNGRGLFSLYSQSPLTTDLLVSGSGTSSVSGPIYSAGAITMPSSSAVSVTGAQLEAEGGFVDPSTDSNTYYDTSPDSSSSPPVSDIRSVTPNPLSLSDLLPQVTEDRAIACSPQNGNLPHSETSELCLTVGSKLTNAAGTVVTVPRTSSSYLLLFGVGGDDQVTVETHAGSVSGTGHCLIKCDAASLATPEVSAETTPGVDGYWSQLGSFYLPASGVIASDGPTYISLCGSSFATDSASCQTRSGSAPGITMARSVTVVAGTPAAPEDVFLAGPIHSSGSSRLGVVATGDVVIPSFARPPGTPLTLDVGVIALGIGDPASQTSALITDPVSSGLTTDNLSPSLTISGSLTLNRIDLQSLSGFSSISYSSDPGMVTDPPPWWPGFGGDYQLVSSTPLTPSQVSAVLGS